MKNIEVILFDRANLCMAPRLIYDIHLVLFLRVKRLSAKKIRLANSGQPECAVISALELECTLAK